ncbi:hypothetical protein L218DRAFT_964485 [Marasmius fiardii PR-910]|nr:hypothetical protein L218DRAFT_964485 [Marasmius fiardii PR-910]
MDQTHFLVSLCTQCQRSLTELDLPHPINPDILHSAYIPTSSEVSQSLQSLEGGIQELKRCEEKIAYWRRQLEELETGKRKLENHITHLRSSISAWRKVPVEIWESIFMDACLLSSPDGFSFSMTLNNSKASLWESDKINIVMFPVIISHVCSRWRSIATGCSALWSSISIDLSRFPQGRELALRTFLRRSSAHSIDLRISADIDNFRNRPTTWELLTYHFFRSKRLILTTDISILNTLKSCRDLNNTFHDLSLFCLQPSGYSQPLDEDNSFWKALAQAPKLTEVQLSKLLSRRTLPYTQLTSLAIDFLHEEDISNLFTILGESRNLHSLWLGFIDDYHHLNNPLRRIVMPSLQALVIGRQKGLSSPFLPYATYATSLDEIFSSLVMPSLSRFELKCILPFTVHNGPPLLITMLQHSFLSLRQMVLSFTYISNDPWSSLPALFRTTPHLRHFELGEAKIGRLYFHDIEPSLPDEFILSSLSELSFTDDNTFLPNLDSLTLTNIRLTTDIMNKVISLATSRSPKIIQSSTVDGLHSLKELRVVHIPPNGSPSLILESGVEEAMEELRRDGIKIDIQACLETFPSGDESPPSDVW